MTRKEAGAIIIELRAKGEVAFTETFGIEQGVYSEQRPPFLLGFMQAAFVEALIESHKTVLS